MRVHRPCDSVSHGRCPTSLAALICRHSSRSWTVSSRLLFLLQCFHGSRPSGTLDDTSISCKELLKVPCTAFGHLRLVIRAKLTEVYKVSLDNALDSWFGVFLSFRGRCHGSSINARTHNIIIKVKLC